MVKKYDIIYADPPWKYRFSVSHSRDIENQYPTMELKDICALNIPAADNAVLYLWATVPKLDEALQVVKAWGFDYRSCIIWDKQSYGAGWWARIQHELLLIAVKGKFKPPAPQYRFRSIFSIKKTTHSKKPDCFYEIIEKAYPNSNKLELFSRRKRDDNDLFNKSQKWDVWGDEVNSDIKL